MASGGREKRMEKLGPVVASAHLAEGPLPALSELEFALTMTDNAFTRWIVRCMTGAGYPDLGPLDIQVLHAVNHRDRPKKLADICLILNIEDTHTVTYALKKLAGRGLVVSGRLGKEKIATITDEGRTACLDYRRIREGLLIGAVEDLGIDEEQMSRLAALLRVLSGVYDQAARGAAVI